MTKPQKKKPKNCPPTPEAEVFNALMRSSFGAFFRKVFQTLKPGEELSEAPYLDVLAGHLDQVTAGHVKKLRINLPPRCLKSMMISVAYVAFRLGQDPSLNFIVMSHNLTLGKTLSHQFRKVVSSAWYQSAFPKMRGAPDKDTELIYRTSEGGGRSAVSKDMDVTGLGADIIILDDPVAASFGNDQDHCQKTHDWLAQDLFPRFNNKTRRVILLAMQRIGLYDTSAHFEDASGWTSLVLPARFEANYTVDYGNKKSITFYKGDLLDPERLTEEALEEELESMGPAAFSAQYLQKPVPEGAGLIETRHFNVCENAPQHSLDYSFLSVDPASGSDGGSYSAIQIFHVKHGLLFMVKSFRVHFPIPRLINTILATRKHFNVEGIVVEATGIGRAVAETLWEMMSYKDRALHLHPIHPKTSKEDRMFQAMVEVQRLNVFLQQSQRWNEAFFNEVRSFPSGKYDDQIDAFSQAVYFYRNMRPHWPNPTNEDRKRYLLRCA